jgi:hypothetical protein
MFRGMTEFFCVVQFQSWLTVSLFGVAVNELAGSERSIHAPEKTE